MGSDDKEHHVYSQKMAKKRAILHLKVRILQLKKNGARTQYEMAESKLKRLQNGGL